MAGLDGERYIERVNSLDPEGASLLLKTQLTGIHKRGSGGVVEQEAILTDESGKVFYRMISGSFLVGAKGFSDCGISSFAKIPVPNRAPDKVVEQKTSPFQAQLYRLSGDYNPLHIEPGFAQMSGFKAPILHGLCSLGFSARVVLSAYANSDSEMFKALKVRFASPVMPGQTLVVKMWKESRRIIFITSVKETGKVVINNSFMDLTPVASL